MQNVSQTIVAEARTWLGTPFAHQGRVKGQGVDCLGLLIGVAETLRLCGADGTPLACRDSVFYGHYPDEKRLRTGLESCLEGLPVHAVSSDLLLAGRIGLFRIDGAARHLGLFANAKNGEYPTLIHAYAPARKVVEHRFDATWQERLVAVYGVPRLLDSIVI